jgi:LuxR family maltose regulon positive regulatory protein
VTTKSATPRAEKSAKPSAASSRRDRWRAPAFEVIESKLRPPPVRPGIIPRAGLLDRLLDGKSAPVLAVVAPAGYGKTTLLAQWAERKQPRVGWLSADGRDNDPAVLLTYLAMALDRIEPIDQRLFGRHVATGAAISEVARLVSCMASMSEPPAMVIDHADAITNRECRDVIAELAVRLPPGAQLVIASRHEPPVPIVRLRSQGALVELGLSDLAMDDDEATSLLAGAGVDLPADERRALFERIEGWPAGLYLAALAMNAGSRRATSGFTLAGDDRFVADYLRSEFLGRVSRADVSFLTRTSILDRVNGPLGDATVGRSGSAAVLDRLERRNLLVVPLDRRREWYRYHHLFRELLYAELVRREPDTLSELHRRAAEWYEANGLPEQAIEHAQAAGDGDRAARLVLLLANPVWASGREATVLGWMEWFSREGLLGDHPALAVHGALIYALVGRPGDAVRWAAVAERSTVSGLLADGNTMAGSISYLRALLCRDGVDQMRTDAHLALGELSALSPYRPAMLHALGAADFLEGDLERADSWFTQAVGESTAVGLAPFIPVVLAERGIVAIERGDWSEADALEAHALAVMKGGDFDDYWTSALVYAWAARTAAHRGDLSRALDLVTRAARLRPLLTYALPVVSAQALLELAQVYTALSDPSGARVALRQLRDILQVRPHLGRLVVQAESVRADLQGIKGVPSGVSSLTAAELRLLPLLASHLSLGEIGERFFVSRNTIKTQAISIYRKFGVSSRSATVTRMHELGMLSPATAGGT